MTASIPSPVDEISSKVGGANGLTASSTNSFQVDYVTMDGRRSPISASTTGATWSGLNWNGIPDEWMAEFFGGFVDCCELKFVI